MNNDRIIIIENVANQPVGLKDTQGRIYRLGTGAKIRISAISLQDIFDYPASKIIFGKGLVKVRNISADALYNMGLTEEEIEKFSLDAFDAVVVTKKIEEPEEEEEVIEIKEEEPVEEKPVAKPVAKKTTAKKPAAKKTTTKKATSSKSK